LIRYRRSNQKTGLNLITGVIFAVGYSCQSSYL